MKTIIFDGVAWELPYHDLLPPLSPSQFEELKADILDTGGNVYPVLWGRAGERRRVIDGGHRLQATADLWAERGEFATLFAEQCIEFATPEEERQAALDLNLKRRQLSTEERAAAILKLRQEGKSTRAIAEQVGTSEATVRRSLSTASSDAVELPSVIVGKDGKERQAQRPASSPAGEHAATEELTPEERAIVADAVARVHAKVAALEAKATKKDLTPEHRAQIAESVEIAFAKAGPLHPTTLLPSEPPAQTAPREAAEIDEGQEAGAPAPKGAPAIMASGREDHNTPPEVLAVVRAFGGGRIDLDPCHNEHSLVGASVALTKAGDGLGADWGALIGGVGLVFVNPPYDQEALARLNERASAQAGRGLEVVSLVPVKADQQWLQLALALDAAAICFIAGRVRFWADGARQQGAAFESCLIYYGGRPSAFCEHFAALGVCLDLTLQRRPH